MGAASGSEWLFVVRRGAANRAVKAAAEFGRDNVKTNGSEIDTDVLIAIVVCLTIRLRKFGATGPAAFRASEGFSPLIASSHPANVRRKRAGSSQYPCHKQTDALPMFGVHVGHLRPFRNLLKGRLSWRTLSFLAHLKWPSRGRTLANHHPAERCTASNAVTSTRLLGTACAGGSWNVATR
jgi:hypothetical protein